MKRRRLRIAAGQRGARTRRRSNSDVAGLPTVRSNFPEYPVSRRWRARELEPFHPFHTLSGRELAGYSAASCRVPPSHAVTTSSATAPGGSALMPTSVQVG